MKKIAIIQSNYIPWKGYFDLINSVDEYIILDTVQYTKNDWRNRNKIKTETGLKWLTIPVVQKGSISSSINEISIAKKEWVKQHLNLLTINYRESVYFEEVYNFCEILYKRAEKYTKLSEVNELLIKEICSVLKITTKIIRAEELGNLSETSNERLIDICRITGATHYLSGPAAKSYLNEELFEENGLFVEWMDYSGYPEYSQLYGEFTHQVSIIDLLFNVGLENSHKYIKRDIEKPFN